MVERTRVGTGSSRCCDGAQECSAGHDLLSCRRASRSASATGFGQTLWNFKDLAQKHYAQQDEIGRWFYLVSRSYYNGPLNVDRILPVRAAANGNVRFLVDAYQSADGGTTLGQLSIWEWDGREAKPLLIKAYEHLAGALDIRFSSGIIRVGTKERLATLYTCGQCDLPQGTWSLHVSPDGIQDLGHRFQMPEIGWADELLLKIETGNDVVAEAAPVVVNALKAKMESPVPQDQRLSPGVQRQLSLGMLEDCRVTRRGQQGGFELKLDEGSLRFSYVKRNGRPYFTHVKVTSTL